MLVLLCVVEVELKLRLLLLVLSEWMKNEEVSKALFLWMKRNNKYVVNGEKENVNIGIFIWRPHSSVATVGITHLFYGFYRLSLRCICSNNIIPAMNVKNVFSINTPFTRVSQLIFNFIIKIISFLNDDHCKQNDQHQHQDFIKWDTNFLVQNPNYYYHHHHHRSSK
jgi:hypothetical protein